MLKVVGQLGSWAVEPLGRSLEATHADVADFDSATAGQLIAARQQAGYRQKHYAGHLLDTRKSARAGGRCRGPSGLRFRNRGTLLPHVNTPEKAYTLPHVETPGKLVRLRAPGGSKQPEP